MSRGKFISIAKCEGSKVFGGLNTTPVFVYSIHPNVIFWIAISVYVLVAIVKKCLGIEHSLYTILQILSVSLFEKIDLYQLLTNFKYKLPTDEPSNQLNLFT